jgi:phosphate butyryltransferase
MISKLNDIINIAKSKTKKRLVVVYANDSHTIEAVYEAVSNNIVDATLTGEKERIAKICDENSFDIKKFDIIEMSDPTEAGLICCDMINDGKAHLIMKGTITSDDYMRCILNKERGIMVAGSLLSHVTILETNSYHKLLLVSDVAVIPYPTLEQKIKMTKFLVDTAHKLGLAKPLGAFVAPSEKATRKIPSSSDAIDLMELYNKGEFGESIFDGPMGFDLAIDPESVEIKGYKSAVAGNVDMILFPNIDAANVFYKTVSKLLKGDVAAMVVGAKVPAVLTSRGDSAKSKLCSIALAATCTDL